METQRLSKILASHGIASRRQCEKLIFAKRVKVNGKVATEPQMKVNPDVDIILVDHQPIKKTEDVYLLFHKPKGYICSHNRSLHKKVVYDLFSETPSRLFSVGRLDKETSGLLLVTSDGAFMQQVIHPSSNITKEYLVKTNKEILDSHLKILQQGCRVEGKWITPVKVIKVRKGTLKIVVKEGRKREVRLLVEQADLEILELKRIAIGQLKLGTLPEGSYRPLTETEKHSIFANSPLNKSY
jgi:23S rRNA pseudouridine2605 synthase